MPTTTNAAPTAFPVADRHRARRLHERGRYDRVSVYAIPDAAMVCRVAYVIDGQHHCTPTTFWREVHRLYWHGSSAGRMLRSQRDGLPVCLTVTPLDGLLLARCGFNHSIDYRSAMGFGRRTGSMIRQRRPRRSIAQSISFTLTKPPHCGQAQSWR
jgi:uncharacterized protein